MAVCDKTFHILTQPPYGQQISPVAPREAVPLEQAQAFDCSRDTVRHPRESKGGDYAVTSDTDGACCGPSECC